MITGSKPPVAAAPGSLKALARALDSAGAPAAAAAAPAGGAALPPEAAVFAGPIEQIRAATERDQVVTILLDCMTRFAEHVGLFVLQSKQLVCLDGRGPDHVVMSLKWFTVATEEQSPFTEVLATKQIHIGQLADTPQNRAAACPPSAAPRDPCSWCRWSSATAASAYSTAMSSGAISVR